MILCESQEDIRNPVQVNFAILNDYGKLLCESWRFRSTPDKNANVNANTNTSAL